MHCLAGEPSVEGIKGMPKWLVLQLGRHGDEGKGSLGTCCVEKLACCLCVCPRLSRMRYQHTSLDGCYCIAWRSLGNDLALWYFDEIMHGRER